MFIGSITATKKTVRWEHLGELTRRYFYRTRVAHSRDLIEKEFTEYVADDGAEDEQQDGELDEEHAGVWARPRYRTD